jgi:hypothetical protein
MKRRPWIAGALLLVAAVVIALSLFVARGQTHTATVVEVINKVDAHPRPKDDWQPAVVDMVIYGGGQVRTGAESFARLELLEGMVRLSADSIFTVKESVTRRGTLLTTLFLQEGRLWAHLTTDQPHEFIVETGSAVAAVRDTHFSVRVADGETLVSVAEGEIELTAQAQSVSVAAEEQATVEQDQPPSPPEPLSTEERRMWATEGEMPELAPPWVSETVDSAGDVGQESSLALDSSGIPHVVYRDVTNDSLKYAVLSGATWMSGTVETSVGQLGPSLAFDDSDSLHVAYTHRGPYVNHAILRGTTWVIETAVGEPAAEPSLALDSSGNPNIAYCDVHLTEGLKYAYWTGSGWVVREEVDYVLCGNPGVAEALPSLALDSSGTPHIAYYDVASNSIKYTVLRGTTWVSETVETPVGQTGSHLVLDGSGNPHIAYSYSGSVKYAVLKGTSWVVETVDGSGEAPSLALDSSGNPHIAYCAVAGGGLKYAYWTGSEWVKASVDAVECEDPSLALDGSDVPHISYYDTANNVLKYAHRVASRSSETLIEVP